MRRENATSFVALSKRVAVDQIIMAPIGVGPTPTALSSFFSDVDRICDPQLSVFLSSMAIMEGRDAKHIRARFEDIYSPALLANWKIWPAAQVRRQLYVSSISASIDRRRGCGATVYQFLVHALALPRSISTNLWRVLDALPVSP
jgi:hypothetical protein